MTEQWRDIPGYEGSYQASSLGRIRSLRVLKGCPRAGTGYLGVSLTGQRQVAIHQLVAWTFLGPLPPGMEVNHIDNVRTNNAASNLEYVTHTQNVHHAFQIGASRHSFTHKQMDAIARQFFQELKSNTEIARSLLPKKHTVQQLSGMRKKVRSVIGIWRASQRPKGMRNPYERKLTPEKAVQIRKLYAAGAKQTELAKMFNVHPAHVSRVCAGLMWPTESKSN